MDFEYIERVIKLVEEADITELEVESKEGLRVVVKKGITSGIPAPQYIQSPAPQAAAPVAAQPAAPVVDDHLKQIRSPMVGTFYAAPSPDSPMFVEIGTRVKPDTIVCILEAMKVMNEIKAGTSGVIREVLVENGDPVEFDQPLFRIEVS